MKLDENYTLEGEKYNWILVYNMPTGRTNEKQEKKSLLKINGTSQKLNRLYRSM